MSKFALIIESSEAISECYNSVMTRTGEKMLVIEDSECGVEATSHYWHSSYNDSEGFPPFTKLFDSVEAATEFAKRWVGHPWYCKPNGNFEVVEVTPRYKKVLKGYEPVTSLNS